ncbi:MAG: Ig-like domain-containing protein [bacterium]
MEKKFSSTKWSAGPLVFIFLFIAQQSCTDNPITPGDTAVLQGRVVQEGTLRPLQGVLVRSTGFAETAATDENGEYRLEVQLDDSATVLIILSFTKEGFEETSINVAVKNGDRSTIPDAVMTQLTGPVTGSSGDAANVVMIAVQHSRIFVKHSGANETSNLTFEVRDANGIPVDSDHQVKVCFQIVSGPGGGEFVSPDSALTSNSGRVVTTVNSGTLAGTVQIIAEVVDTTIQSEPVPIAINGWLPDQAHFSVAVTKVNFAGIRFFGLTNAITAHVGDKFSNPVPPGTAVQFFSSGGIIEGSSVTDSLGACQVLLISGLPVPPGLNFSELRILDPASLPAYFSETGYALITGQTLDENHEFIYAENIVLFSGTTVIADVSPSTFDLGPDESIDFTFRVSDGNKNPLVKGTEIKVETNNGSVTGDIDIRLDDTRSRAATLFRIKVTNSKPAEIEGTDTTVSISVTSDNGDAKFDIFGTMRKF